ncbi:MAG: GNAT family N-acetyltransferase [Blautia sp.]
MKIRTAKMGDLKELTKVEAQCFPQQEAASKEVLRERLSVYPDHFRILEEDGQILSFINGMVTDEAKIRDEMFAEAHLHRLDGRWQAIFGVDTLPGYQKRGFASLLMEQVIADAKIQGREGCILTCKERLLPFYERFGYVNEGVSQSVHGGAMWYDMRLSF